MKIIELIARYAVGLLFIISGLIKINDPVGTAIKLEEYFDVFSADISPLFLSLVPAALFLSVLLSVLEVLLGLALLLQYRLRWVSGLLLALIVFFTFLTFYSAYFNKVTDCGCFGDALKLTPWQSFTKDIVLLVLIVFLFVYYRKNREGRPVPSAGFWLTLGAVGAIIVALIAIYHLPFIDFRAYKVGTSIPEAMQPSEPYRYSYIMEKGGEEYELDAYPAESEGYTYVEMKTLNPDAGPKIVDFAIWNREGEDLTQQVLQGNKLLVLIQKAEGANTEALQQIKTLVAALGSRVDALVITSINPATYLNFQQTQNFKLPYAYADATVIKTMIRSSPGVMLLREGKVVGKWHYNDVPDRTQVLELLKKP